jgi:hypothetical protein
VLHDSAVAIINVLKAIKLSYGETLESRNLTTGNYIPPLLIDRSTQNFCTIYYINQISGSAVYNLNQWRLELNVRVPLKTDRTALKAYQDRRNVIFIVHFYKSGTRTELMPTPPKSLFLQLERS